MQMYFIIKLKKEGWSDRKISQKYHISRNTVRKYWNKYLEKERLLLSQSHDCDLKEVVEQLLEDPKYDTSNRGYLKYNQEIDSALRKILDDEKKKTSLLGPHHKQKLTKKQIHQLLVDMGFNIGLTTISKRINEIRDEKKEVFIKQQYDYCDRFEYDFGEVKLIIDGKKTKGYLAVLTAPASGFRWAYLYSNMKMAVFLDSHVRFFEMLGGCFKEGVYDNMKNVVSRFIGRNEKELNKELIKLSLYYGYSVNVTNCFSGNEKGNVESAVKWIRNKVFALTYVFDSFEDAADHLEKRLEDINKDSKIKEEKNYLTPYRPKYETAIITNNLVDKCSLVHVDNNTYSVPEDLCGKTVVVKTYPNEIVIYYKGEKITEHARHYTKGKTYIDIRHYLHTLEKKPGALKNSVALKSYPDLKKIFDLYYKQKPKAFIELLRMNAHLDDEQLIDVLSNRPTNKLIRSEEKIKDKIEEQIYTINNMFIGGNNIVN